MDVLELDGNVVTCDSKRRGINVCLLLCPLSVQGNSVGSGTVCLSIGCLGTGARAADKVVDVGRVQEIFNVEWCLQVMYPSLLEWFLGGCDIS
jgi:hypothetical protein